MAYSVSAHNFNDDNNQSLSLNNSNNNKDYSRMPFVYVYFSSYYRH